MAGSGAVVGVLASTSSTAGVRQITLSGNQLTSGGPNSLSADVTRDGVVDLPNLASSTTTGNSFSFITSGRNYVRNSVNTVALFSFNGATFKNFGYASFRSGYTSTTSFSSVTNSFYYFFASAGGYYTNQGYNTGSSPTSATGLTAITFTDARINGGAPTQGFVNTRAFNTNPITHTVQLVRTIFNDANTAAPPGINPNVTYREFDPTIYAQRASLGNKIKKLKKKAKKLKKKNKTKSKKLKKKAKKLQKKLAALA